jgi:HTH-type transcriptional regulator / antitoxin HigA
VATKIARAIDTYAKLVSRFRLVQIKDDAHLQAAHEVIERLMEEDLDASGLDYLNVLVGLVEAYEERRFPIPDASDVDVLRELMRSNGLSQNALAKKVGISQSTISDVLKGVRKLTKDQVIKLAAYFGVAPAAFLPSTPTATKGNWSTGNSASGSGDGIAAAPHS